MGDTGGTFGSVGMQQDRTPKGFGAVSNKVPTTAESGKDGLGYKLPNNNSSVGGGGGGGGSGRQILSSSSYRSLPPYEHSNYALDATASDGSRALGKLVRIMEGAWGAMGNYEAGRALEITEELPENHRER